MKLRIATRSISCKFKNEMRRRAQWRVDRGARISRVITGETPVPLARTCDGEGPTSIIPKSFVAHWCSWLTRCPLKAEITGSSPVCATKFSDYSICLEQSKWLRRFDAPQVFDLPP